MSDGMHLAQQDERANAELHAELERVAYHALRKARMIVSDGEFSALCFLCGFKVSDFTQGKGKQ